MNMMIILGDLPIRVAVKKKNRKFATLSVMNFVWVVVMKDAMQTFINRAISDHAFAYLLCNILSMIERM
jgi:hypothetical protein